MSRIFSNNAVFHNVYVKGEVSKPYTSQYGHTYFTLKDKSSQVPCIIRRENRKNIAFQIEHGMKLLVSADVGIYLPHGKYQLLIKSAVEDGLGQLYVRLQQLKRKLSQEGLFDEKHKKELPGFVKSIGVVTSKGGSVIYDIIKTVRQNWPFCQVVLFPASVQGPNSKNELALQIKRADSLNMDVLIVGRGGGSLEDLWSFNEEEVVRAIFNAKTPVISAIGHEDDVTLCDMVADVRASTPTMAASLAIEDKNAIMSNINHYNERLITFVSKKIDDYKKELKFMLEKAVFSDSEFVYKFKKKDFDDLSKRFAVASTDIVKSKRLGLEKITNEYVIRYPCKMQLDSSGYNLDELKTRLIDAMNFIINNHRVNLDKVTDSFNFSSKNLLKSKNHELEIIKSYLKTNPCQSRVEISKNELVGFENRTFKALSLKISDSRKDLDYICQRNIIRNPSMIFTEKSRNFDIEVEKFINSSNNILTSKNHNLEMVKQYIKTNPCKGKVDRSKKELAEYRNRTVKALSLKISDSRKDLDYICQRNIIRNPAVIFTEKSRSFNVEVDKFVNSSNNVILENRYRLESYKKAPVIKNRLDDYFKRSSDEINGMNLRLEKSYKSIVTENRKDLNNVLESKIIKDPYILLEKPKQELRIYEDRLDNVHQMIELRKAQKKQKATYIKIIVAIITIMIIILIVILGGIL